MSEFITVDTVERVGSLQIPGIDDETMRRIGSAQRITGQKLSRTRKRLGLPRIDKWQIGTYLMQEYPDIFEELKRQKPELSYDWTNYFRLSNKEVGLLLIDGLPLPMHPQFKNLSVAVYPEWVNFEGVEVNIQNPDHPKNAGLMWRIKPTKIQRREQYSLPNLERYEIPLDATGNFPLTTNNIFVFDVHSFTLVKTYEPWQQDFVEKK